jgi:hypothetical protein
MFSAVTRVADRLLAKVAPRVDASAGCSYVWEICYCSGGLRYGRRCMRGCSGVPNHCYPCTVMGGC